MLIRFLLLIALSAAAMAGEVKGVFHNSSLSLTEQLQMLDDPEQVAAAKSYEPDFLRVCELYLASNRFHDFFRCIDELESRQFRYVPMTVAEFGGEVLLHAQHNGDDWLQPHEVAAWRFISPRSKRLRLEALYRLNDFEQAYRVGSDALAQYLDNSGGIEVLQRQAVNFTPQSSWSADIIVTAGLTALAAVHTGRSDDAEHILSLLRRLHTELDFSQAMLEPDYIRNAYIRMIQLQLGRGTQLDYIDWESHRAKSYLLGTSIILLGFVAGDIVANIGQDMIGSAELEAAERLRIQLQNAKLAVIKNDPSRALKDYTAVIDHPDISRHAELHWIALFERGRLYTERGELQRAATDLQAAVVLIESSRGKLSTESMKIGFSGSRTQVYQQLVEVLIARGEIEQAFAMAERSRARSMIDMLADEALQNRASLSLQVVGSSAALAGPQRLEGGDSQRALKRKLKTMHREQPQVASLLAVAPEAFEGLAALIGHDETLVEYFDSGASWYAFVVSRQRTQVIELGLLDVATMSRQFREALGDTSSDDYKRLAKQLYRTLWQPLQPHIDSEHVVVVADAALHYVPMAALYDGERFLLQRYRSIRQLPSLAASRYIPRSSTTTAGSLILGNPSGDLPGAEVEAKRVAALYPRHSLLLRQRATKASLLAQAADYRILHVASHGVYDSVAPLDSYLLLADGEGGEQRLTVGELYRARLDNDLVVLSGCETGLNEIANGNDLLGFTRGFMFAGSRAIVSSLWRVDDEATAQLMQGFHRELARRDNGRALNSAQRQLMQRYPHPYYWAAFQLTGAR